MFYETILEWLETYFIPAGTSVNVNDFPVEILPIVAVFFTCGALWLCVCRPFIWIFKYGLWGGSKKHRKLNNYDED